MTLLLQESRGSAVILTLNRPEKLNALNYALVDALSAALDELEKDRSVRAIVLTGAGDRAFSAGADIAEFAGSIEAGVETALREFVRRGQRLTGRIETFSKPIIAAVNGIAFGGGCEVTEAAHLAVASERARFAKPEIRLGFPPPFGGTQRLPRHVGRKRALEMILTGDAIDAEKAERIGLINRVVAHESLLQHALALAESTARHSEEAVAASLRSVTRGINVPIDEGLAIEATQFAATAQTDGVRRGISDFLAKRR